MKIYKSENKKQKLVVIFLTFHKVRYTLGQGREIYCIFQIILEEEKSYITHQKIRIVYSDI